MSPSKLLLDVPFVFLEPQNRIRSENNIVELSKKGSIFFLVPAVLKKIEEEETAIVPIIVFYLKSYCT